MHSLSRAPMLLLLAGCGGDPIDVTYDRDSKTSTPTDTDADSGSDTRGDSGTSDPAPQPTWCTVSVEVSRLLVLGRVDMATGAWAEIGRYPGLSSSYETASLAYDGSVWAFPSDSVSDHPRFIVDPTLGAITLGAEPRDYDEETALTWDGARWLGLNNFEGVFAYDTTESLLAGTIALSIGRLNSIESRFTYADGELYAAVHSADDIAVYDAATLDWRRTIELEDFDTWVYGMSVAGGKLHLVDDGRDDQRLMSFDLTTGAVLETVSPVGPHGRVGGLWCDTSGS